MSNTASSPISLADVESAAARLESAVSNTPLEISKTLSERCDSILHLKFENLQFTGSFKERGALNKLLSLTREQKQRGVIAVSAGNHAQAVAYHATRLGIKATIVMPAATPFGKVSNTEALGAEVILHGATFDDASQFARRLTQDRQLVMIHPYDDPWVIAGQGSLALELLDRRPELDVLVLPIGGGGLIAGVAIAAKARKPSIQVIGVQSERYPFMAHALHPERTPLPSSSTATLAEGIAVKEPGQLTRQYTRELVDEIVLVSESEIEEAINLYLEFEKTVVEGAGAAGLAALLKLKPRFAGKQVATVLTGGNIDQRVLADTILRGLVRTGRLTRIRVPTRDQPGELARLTGVLAASGANIVEVHHHRVFSPAAIMSPQVELVIATRDRMHAASVVAALREAGHAVTE